MLTNLSFWYCAYSFQKEELDCYKTRSIVQLNWGISRGGLNFSSFYYQRVLVTSLYLQVFVRFLYFHSKITIIFQSKKAQCSCKGQRFINYSLLKFKSLILVFSSPSIQVQLVSLGYKQGFGLSKWYYYNYYNIYYTHFVKWNL